MSDESIGVPLASFVSALRSELKEAQRSTDPELRFIVGPVDVEFTVVTTREGGTEGKVRFWVVEAGGSAKFSREATQKLSMTLTPVDADNLPISIKDKVVSPPK